MSEEQVVETPVKKAKKTSFKDILAGVSELNKQQMVSVYVPSMNDEIKFKPLTVKQQKLILSSGVDTEIENLAFNNATNSIILENCLSSKNKITLIDKPIILLQLRQNAVSDTLKITDGDNEHTVNINEHVQTIRDSIKGDSELTFKVESDGVTIEGVVPTLDIDTKYNKQFTKSVKKSNKRDLTLSDVVGDIYIHEMVKYVKTISIGDNTLQLDDNVSVEQTINVFESLPMTISNKVATAIKNVRDIEIRSLDSSNLPDGVQINIDASIFAAE